MNAKDCCKQLFSCPVAVSSGIILISAISLGAAYTSQYAYGLEPCILCLYQRLPYMVAILLGLIGLFARKNYKLVSVFVFLSALTFLVGAAIAVYHVGVEQKLWVSAVEGCKAVFDDGGKKSLIDQIMSGTTARCDEIAWQDPVLGISMAGYNALLSLFLFVSCSLAAVRIRQRPSG